MEAQSDAADLLYRVPAIARYLGVRERQARHSCEAGRIPTFRIGAIICARRSDIDTWIAGLAAEARKVLAHA